MADCKRLRILKALTALLETITTANGYQHTLTGNVYRGRNAFGSSEPLPMLSVLEYPRPDEDEGRAYGSNKHREDWDLLVQGFVDDDKLNPTDPAHNLMADTKKALALIRAEGSAYFRLGGEVVDMVLNGGVVRPPDDVSAKAHFYLRVTLKVVEDVGDPYL